ncbi:uncharacterized protein RAG0_09782 [Rhynchosporium agropyri]|uniref:Transcriptional coactivator p15 (PC4) C-terminal domain-containing protein n=1 Tax=Rhynchosporium agropyri TaxID=914238 RepID=A0A1E1KX01_9HELO|nr:uncharacterized protein RAG0_09782 [Rhynchosporium agropyri]
MAKGKAGKRGHEEVNTYEEDDFVENDDGAAPKSKKTKKAQSSSDDAENFWELSNGRNSRRVTVQEFKGQKLINIREYYEKDGEFKPSSKGISLTVDQYKILLEIIPKVNTHLKGMGIDVAASEVPDGESEEERVPKKRVKPTKQEKANIEATSDEDEN